MVTGPVMITIKNSSFLDKINPRLSYSLRINGPKILLGIILISVFTPFSILGIIIEPFHDLVAVIIGVY